MVVKRLPFYELRPSRHVRSPSCRHLLEWLAAKEPNVPLGNRFAVKVGFIRQMAANKAGEQTPMLL